MNIRDLVRTRLNGPLFTNGRGLNTLHDCDAWRAATEAAQTRLGYSDWLSARIEEDCDRAVFGFRLLIDTLHQGPSIDGVCANIISAFRAFHAVDTALLMRFAAANLPPQTDGPRKETCILPTELHQAALRLVDLTLSGRTGKDLPAGVALEISDLLQKIGSDIPELCSPGGQILSSEIDPPIDTPSLS